MFEEPALEKLFTVSRVEVIQHISAEELKSVIQQLAKNISDLQDGPKLEDFNSLQNDFESLKVEVSELRIANQEKHEALQSKQASLHARFATLQQKRRCWQLTASFLLQEELQGLLESLEKAEWERGEVNLPTILYYTLSF